MEQDNFKSKVSLSNTVIISILKYLPYHQIHKLSYKTYNKSLLTYTYQRMPMIDK